MNRDANQALQENFISIRGLLSGQATPPRDWENNDELRQMVRDIERVSVENFWTLHNSCWAWYELIFDQIWVVQSLILVLIDGNLIGFVVIRNPRGETGIRGAIGEVDRAVLWIKNNRWSRAAIVDVTTLKRGHLSFVIVEVGIGQ